MATEWVDDDGEIRKIATGLISSVEDHEHLREAPIRYVFRTEHQRSKGRMVYGKAHLISGLAAHLAGPVTVGGAVARVPFFVIEIAADVWERMTDLQRAALVDHELCHLWWDRVTMKGQIRPHSVEEFIGVVERHGLWDRALYALESRAGTQMSLEDAEPFRWIGDDDGSDG